MCTCAHVCLYVRACVCAHVCAGMCVYMYTHTHTLSDGGTKVGTLFSKRKKLKDVIKRKLHEDQNISGD